MTDDVSPKPCPGLRLSQTPFIVHAQFVEQFKLKSILFFPYSEWSQPQKQVFAIYALCVWLDSFFFFSFCVVFAKGLNIIIVVKQPSEQ